MPPPRNGIATEIISQSYEARQEVDKLLDDAERLIFQISERRMEGSALPIRAILRDTFAADGATKSEWQRTCHDVAERTFHRAAKMLEERGYVKLVGTRYRITGKVSA